MCKDPCIIPPTIPVVVIEALGTGAALTGPGVVESSGNSDNALGIGVWLMEMDLGSSGGERCRVTSSATRVTSCFNKSRGRERVCGSTETALELWGTGQCRCQGMRFGSQGWAVSQHAWSFFGDVRSRLQLQPPLLKASVNVLCAWGAY